MWNPRALFVARRFFNHNDTRQVRQVGSVSAAGYMHNPGSEPLQYATVGAAVEHVAHAHPGRTALRSVHEDLTLTYEQLLTQADAFGYALRTQGLEKNDRVGIWSHNNAAWIVALVGTLRAGLIPVAINPVYEKPELSYCIKKTGLKSLLIGNKLQNRDYYKTINELIPEMQNSNPGAVNSKAFPTLTSIISGEQEKLSGAFTYSSLITEHVKRSHEVTKYGDEVSPDDGSIIHFTSGTTGNPKAALDSHFGVVNNTYFTGKRNEFHEEPHRICVQVPIFHALGSVITVLAGLRHGCTLVLAAPTYNVASNLNALYSEKCTVITGTPTMFVDLISEVQSRGDPPPSLRVALAAGAPCSPQLIRHMQTYLNAELVKTLYGMTETTACVFQSMPGESIDVVAETVGYIQDHVEAKVMNEEGKIVPFGSPGELLVRGYNNMICYWDEPEKTRETLGEDGWLRTGDKFVLGEDGYGRIVGRLKDIIVRGGENIAPKEIEDVLNTHPDIIESQVVGVSDERLGEELCAVLRVRKGACLDAAAVARHCSGRLARFKIPRLLKLTNEFPKTTSGKIQKFKLTEMIESGKL